MKDVGGCEVREGRTILIVPRDSVDTKVPPHRPAFYNPLASLNRDLSVLAYRAFASTLTGEVTLADSMAGTGARGVRVAVEAPEVGLVHLNDHNPTAIEYARLSAERNGVEGRCTFTVSDVCRFLTHHSEGKERFDMVDIDPFGSPSPYLDCGIRALRDRGLLSVTATDQAVLSGVYPKACFRKYYGYPLRTEYCHEIGVRLLLGSLVYCAIRFNLGMLPLFSHTTQHYTRVYVTLTAGKLRAQAAAEGLGFILHCFRCGHRCVGRPEGKPCEECGSSLRWGGPLWVKELHSENFLKEMLSFSTSMERCERILETALEETGMPPAYYVPDRIADGLGVASPGPRAVIAELRQRGFRASRTVMNPKGVKSDAPIDVVSRVIMDLSPQRGSSTTQP